MNNKLGWLRRYRADIFRWSQCQKVVSAAVTFVNERGVFRGAADQLARLLASVPMCEAISWLDMAAGRRSTLLFSW